MISSSTLPRRNEGRSRSSITKHHHYHRRHGGSGGVGGGANPNTTPTSTPTIAVSSTLSTLRGQRGRQERGRGPPSTILQHCRCYYSKKKTPCPIRTIILLLLFLFWRGFFHGGDDYFDEQEGILLLLGLNDTTTTTAGSTTTLLDKKTKTNTILSTPGEELWHITTHRVTTHHIPLANTTSRKGWEEIAPYVQHAQAGVLCLGWETTGAGAATAAGLLHNATTSTSTTTPTTAKSSSTPGQSASDVWWTHHPDWGVYNETDQGYCFRPHPDVLQREYLTSVYQHQFPPAATLEEEWCQDPDHVHVTRMWSSGWSADLWNLIHTLQYAWTSSSSTSQKIMEIHTNPWHYAAPDQAGRANPGRPSPPACDLLTMYCYFLPLSACSTGSRQLPNVTVSKYDYRHPPLLSNRAKQYLPYYIARPQTWLRHEVYQFVKTQRRQATTSIPSTAVPCTVLHVRRGDVVQHGNQSRRYHALKEYLQVLGQKILLRVNNDDDNNNNNNDNNNNNTKNTNATTTTQRPKKHNLLLLTDDANAILESKEYPQYHWMYIDRPRFQADQGGWEHQLPSSQPILEMTILWATFSLVQQCSHLIYSTSGFSQWLLWVMRQSQSRQSRQGQRRNRGVQAYNLDEEILITKGEPIFGHHHVHSKNISTMYSSSSSHQQQQQHQQRPQQPRP